MWGWGKLSSLFSRTSLRGRVAIGVALPLLLALTSFSIVRYQRERSLLEAQARHTAAQLGEALAASLRHAMLVNDRRLLDNLVQDVGGMDVLDRVLLLDQEGVVRADSRQAALGSVERVEAAGCQECHAYPASSRPRAVYRSDVSGILRVATPVENEPACYGCHPATQAHLGVLLADVPLLLWQQDLVKDLGWDLATSVAGTLVITALVYALVHRILVRRLELVREPLAALSAGDLTARIPNQGTKDELDQIADAVNAMAGGLARHLDEEQERQAERSRAIAQERERIARELHDGLGQLLGYVNTKAMAVRILLQGGQTEAAAHHLEQLEEAAREVSTDVRLAIQGLRRTAEADADFASTLRNLVDQAARLSGVPVAFAAEDLDDLRLPSEVELNLLRITQEALTNVRRHADASSAEVRIERRQGGLQLRIQDDGQGFPDGRPDLLRASHYGLAMMGERAAEIGAQLSVESQPGAGTSVSIRWNFPEEENDGRPGRR
jgi:signal transduction histidine kinase